MGHYADVFQINTQLGTLLLKGNYVKIMKTMKADDLALLKPDSDGPSVFLGLDPNKIYSNLSLSWT